MLMVIILKWLLMLFCYVKVMNWLLVGLRGLVFFVVNFFFYIKIFYWMKKFSFRFIGSCFWLLIIIGWWCVCLILVVISNLFRCFWNGRIIFFWVCVVCGLVWFIWGYFGFSCGCFCGFWCMVS